MASSYSSSYYIASPSCGASTNSAHARTETATKRYEHWTVEQIIADFDVLAIVFANNGRQLREVITGGRTVQTWADPSKRYRCTVYGEGKVAWWVRLIAEVDNSVLAYSPEHCRVEVQSRTTGEICKSVVDYALVRRGEAPTLGECKSSWAEFEKPRAKLQQAVTQAGADALGWNYERRTPQNIGSPAYLEAVRLVHAHQFQHVSERQKAIAANAVANGATTVAELAEMLSSCAANGLAAVCALMVQRVVEIDLSNGLDDDSVVTAAEPMPLWFPPIRFPRHV